MRNGSRLTIAALAAAIGCSSSDGGSERIPAAAPTETLRERAGANADALVHVHRYLSAWLGTRRSPSGLIPRALPQNTLFENSPYWNAKDCAADNYSFMVLSAWFTDRAAFEGPITEMLAAERILTKPPEETGLLHLPYDYSLEGDGQILPPEPTPGYPYAIREHFGAAEYLKDGIVPIVELLGLETAWAERGDELLEDIWATSTYETPFGLVPVMGAYVDEGTEMNGNLLQAMARLYWARGRDERYLEWGVRLADLQLLPEGGYHPTRDYTRLILTDHGSEIIGGLAEFYATLHFAGEEAGGEKWAQKQGEYRPHLHELLDDVLALGRNEDGLFYRRINPVDATVLDDGLADTFGYVLNAYHLIGTVDGIDRFVEAAFEPLRHLADRYPDPFPGDMDANADAIEGALNLLHEAAAEDFSEPLAGWIDANAERLLALQKADGFIEYWYGDGNYSRTALMYAFWKSGGVYADPYVDGLGVGMVWDSDGADVLIQAPADSGWSGKLHFDHPRHHDIWRLPFDWARINRFPEWYVAEDGVDYLVTTGDDSQSRTGQELQDGIAVTVAAGRSLLLRVSTSR